MWGGCPLWPGSCGLGGRCPQASHPASPAYRSRQARLESGDTQEPPWWGEQPGPRGLQGASVP